MAEEARRLRLIEPAAPDPGAVVAAFRLPGAPVAMTPVAGGWSNRVHRLETTAGAYVVKELLNPWEDHATARAVVRAYRDAGGAAAPIAPGDPGGTLASRLDWIAFNVGVALGRRRATAGRRPTADELMPRWLRTLPGRVETALGVDTLLNV